MTLSYGSGLPPEEVSHTWKGRDGVERRYRAIQGTGNNWDVIAPDGTLIKNGITHSNRWQASAQLTTWAMETHDAGRHMRTSPIRDRIVAVDDAGNVSDGAIINSQFRGGPRGRY